MRKRWKPELRPVLAYNLKPVIAAVHGACVGGGVDIVAACDIWCCSKDTTFVLKEVDMAIVADLGALQWLPRIVGYGNAANLALTGRKITSMEDKEMGLVSRVFNSKQELDDGVAKIAKGKDALYWSGRPFRRKPS